MALIVQKYGGTSVGSIEKIKAVAEKVVHTHRKGHRMVVVLSSKVLFAPGRTNPLPLRPGSPELLFLQRLRDAAHRHALGRQRRARTGRMLKSELLTLDGVGPSTARLLWDRFGSLEAMARATRDDLAALPGIGRKKAARLAASLAGLGSR